MALSSDLISQFSKITNDNNSEKKDTTLYGTVSNIVDNDDDTKTYYVKMDGSSVETPVISTVELNKDDRVLVTIKNHTATVTGNMTNVALGKMTEGNLRSEIAQTAGKIEATVKGTYATIEDVNKYKQDAISAVDVMYALGDSNTTPPTSGWQTNAPTWESGKYMWQKTVTTHADGSVTESAAAMITGIKGDQGVPGLNGLQGPQGEQGIPGKDGSSSYFHIRYSEVSNPTSASQMTETPSTYIGTYVDNVSTDSDDPSKYKWQRLEGAQGPRGEQGIPGIGQDGKTTYLHIAYATNSTGTEGFSVSESDGKLYIGQYTDFEQTDSTDPTKYKWTKIKGNGILRIEEEYYKSTSKETLLGGEWTTTPPTWSTGYYIWTRSHIYYTDGADEYTTAICDNSWEAANLVNQDLQAVKQEYSTKFEQTDKKFEAYATLEVYNAQQELIANHTASFHLTSEQFGAIVTNNNQFAKFWLDAKGFYVTDETGKIVSIDGGCIDASSLNLTDCITFKNVETAANDAKTTANSAKTTANSAKTTANGVASDLEDLMFVDPDTEKITTYIDGSKIASESIYANKIHLGGSLKVYKSLKGTKVGGYLGYDSGFNSSAGIGMRYQTVDEAEAKDAGDDIPVYSQVVCTDKAARLSYGNPDGDGNYAQVVTDSDGDISLDAYNTSTTKGYVYLKHGTTVVARTYNDGANNMFIPGSNSKIYLGKSSHYWIAVYSDNYYGGTAKATGSDRNLKNSIEDLPNKYVEMFDQLRPVRYKLNNGTSDRYHVGYIAQEVEEAMTTAGIDSQEFGGLVKDKNEDGSYTYMLRYGEFDAIRDAKIKQLESQLVEAYAMIGELKTRLDNLEAKEVS